MTDRITKKQRSINMARVKGKNTALEISVRRALFKAGYRFRLFYKLPGKPDIVIPSKKTVIFVHGCFWHQHGCKKAALPTSNTQFWTGKLTGNKERDLLNQAKLKELGWNVLILWECELNTTGKLENAIKGLINKIELI